MKRSLGTALVVVVAWLAFAGTAQAAGGNYVLEGGSPEAQETVRAALNASAFDFSRVPAQITIRITSCGCAGARPGLIVLDETVLTDASLGDRYSWALIQHEYAHQVDYFLFEEADRTAVRKALGGRDWCYEKAGLAHDAHGCERFADVFAWAFWPARKNILRSDAKTFAPDQTPSQLRVFVNSLLAS
jgi:hypothetical protein